MPAKGEEAGAGQISGARAIAAGLRFHPVVDTARDTLAWFTGLPAERKSKLHAGLSPEKEREVLEACESSDLLVLARGGEPRRDPKSLGRWGRFVLDHAGCAVLLVWPEDPPGLEAVHWPPHLR